MTKPRFRIHLSSLMTFVLAFSALAYVCFFHASPKPRDPDAIAVEPLRDEAYGWPLLLVLRGEGSVYTPDMKLAQVYTYTLYRSGVTAFAPGMTRYFFGCLVVDLAVALVPSLLLARWVERRARRKDPLPAKADADDEADSAPH